MLFTTHRLASIVALSALALATPASASETRSQTLAAGSTLQVRALDGSIDVVRGSGRTVVVATASQPDGAAPDMHVVENRSERTWIVCAVALARTSCDDRRQGDEGAHRTRIDFRVTLPDGVRFEARNVSGNVRVRDVASDVDAATVSGMVAISTTGNASAKSVSGPIDLEVGRIDDAVSIDTVSGDIRLAVPKSANVSLDAKTLSGAVTGSGVSFGETPGFVGRDAAAKLGRGGTPVTITSVSGSISVRTL